jgi:hypothetical protein
MIPRVLFHSTEHFVLAIEDLGDLVTLKDALVCLSTTSIDDATAATQQSVYERLGSQIGHFFADIHGASAAESIRHLSTDTLFPLTTLSAGVTRGAVREFAVMPIRERLIDYGNLTPELVDKLADRVLQDFDDHGTHTETSAQTPWCLALGDSHPGCVLFDPETPAEGGTPAIIDWEFASFGPTSRGPDGDVPQFMAEMLVISMASASDRARQATKAFIDGFVRIYGEMMGFRDQWSQDCNSTQIAKLMRSAMIVMGREIVNRAVEGNWQAAYKSICEVVEVGIWYLERAGDDVDGMLEMDNWEMVTGDANVMWKLFGYP